jgi:phosphoglycerate kinase
VNSLQSAPIQKGSRVFVRADLDVPLENETIVDTFRLDNLVPTLRYIIEKGGIPIIGGKIGRPKGEFRKELSTKNLSSYFDNAVGEDKYELLENLLFDSREEENDSYFAKELADKAELYVNESFAESHREYASLVTLPKLLPSFAGLRLVKEVEVLGRVLKDPKRPLITLVGGAKLESKKPIASKFLSIADAVLIGGRIGLAWDEKVPVNLFLPVDYAAEEKDIGPKTTDHFVNLLKTAKTVVWAGPMGMFEDPKYIEATSRIAHVIANSHAFSIVGGGDTISALKKVGILHKMSFVSTGGGAMLEFLVKGNLPAIKVLG